MNLKTVKLLSFDGSRGRAGCKRVRSVDKTCNYRLLISVAMEERSTATELLLHGEFGLWKSLKKFGDYGKPWKTE